MATLTNTGDELSWAERMILDPSLRQFVNEQIAIACVDLSVAQVEARHWKRTAEQLGQELERYRSGDAMRQNRERQRKFRSRRSFVQPTAGD